MSGGEGVGLARPVVVPPERVGELVEDASTAARARRWRSRQTSVAWGVRSCRRRNDSSARTWSDAAGAETNGSSSARMSARGTDDRSRSVDRLSAVMLSPVPAVRATSSVKSSNAAYGSAASGSASKA